MSKFTKKCMARSDAVFGQRPNGPYISLLKISTFLNRCIPVKTSLINTKLGDFVNLGVLLLTMWISSCCSCLSHNLQTHTSSFSVAVKLGNKIQAVFCLYFVTKRERKRHGPRRSTRRPLKLGTRTRHFFFKPDIVRSLVTEWSVLQRTVW